uniref:Phosphofructokinase domain-containing protein n=1 Tax=Neobodo designis TaxID=312471 RepID=A0A7S1Q0N6_NEODS|mmetsp:Transcript_27197/g.84272  ORF Transcript_27197/g.84272 Transcript_27197/m.84272 type:complete len:503 (+) Transcript_27197:43-1551(+)|eukprot:CAMPEP_0174851966 /NCGR_PEP_ID=MMETSP1114-20130205/24721_1 /TAXON_ID=312471 /ORGANISM="Neobodo designis, Strain CCAP 1951/1" /LENGTH=502 /DNA_ID=CAMNT_0016086535 /DNA_START=43 /DNA_END=1551 /DNA_ORIENTATION=+
MATATSRPVPNLGNRIRKSSRTVMVDAAATDILHLKQQDFEPPQLPGRNYVTPIASLSDDGSQWCCDDNRYIMYDPTVHGIDLSGQHAQSVSSFRMRVASPGMSLHFNPKNVVIGIVTCGGLCPGLNDVVRGVTYMARRTYGVKRVWGFRYGFWGLSAAGRDTAIELDSDRVTNVHRRGGTFLGSSRGPQKPSEMVDTLVELGINILFTIGGDGTQKGAATIGAEARRRGLDIAVVGIPKTIDNDLSFSHRTFGFVTAVEHATTALVAAHAEASSHPYGVGIVKVMGRHSGFIAAQATVASQQANLCLIPENPISKETFFKLIEARFAFADHVVICVAEGFGQEWMEASGTGTDASGNKKLMDIGTYMRDLVSSWMSKHPEARAGTVKLIDPSYMIRAVPANTSDAAFCVNLATLAVHEAMRGTTDSIIANWYNNFIVVPIRLATALRKVVCLKGEMWRQVREVTIHIRDAKDMRDRKAVVRRRIATLESDLAQAKRMLAKL